MDISPDEFRRGPKNPSCAFFLIQDGRHHVTPFSKNRGIPKLLTFAVRIFFLFRCLYLCLRTQRVHPDDQE